MKKLLLAAALFYSTFFFSQKNQDYLRISYTSVCCGPASEKPIISYLKEFKRKNQIRSLEILIQRGLGREGEFELYVGIDFLTNNQRKRLVRGLTASVSNQNNNKKSQNIGNINFDPADIAHREDLINAKNLTIYKK
ncbi:hypothetical protein KB553_06030 [Chryseobacterium rhizoplanae]|uniref:hypothetical protein n=1 Tax=Chryseobacterium rhizoplanae TaxID=1609531 RepID=UPI001CE24496|nr:hypothetical protein [Chryseobacterium rhizoplanae]UCA61086.1 hypothetical protein KB553_06030 [Chryseobacterium rhizoplanae]